MHPAETGLLIPSGKRLVASRLQRCECYGDVSLLETVA
jgi:hypothetical protein